MRIVTILSVAMLLGLAACGRKSLPVPPTPEGQPARPYVIAPDGAGTARAPEITNRADETSIVPQEVTRNPGAAKRPFILDGLLN